MCLLKEFSMFQISSLVSRCLALDAKHWIKKSMHKLGSWMKGGAVGSLENLFAIRY